MKAYCQLPFCFGDLTLAGVTAHLDDRVGVASSDPGRRVRLRVGDVHGSEVAHS